MTTTDQQNGNENARETPLSPLALLQTVLAAALGVQSAKNRERDFSRGSVWAFVAVGLFATACFIGTLAVLVSWITSGG